jgi:hypothetical protein
MIHLELVSGAFANSRMMQLKMPVEEEKEFICIAV